jgi:ATP/maltotriose-dependent transcriptional regulator MalT
MRSDEGVSPPKPRRPTDEGLPIPRSKFGCPLVPPRVVPRPRLLDALAGDEWRVALVTGGAATGKTVLAAQWFQSLEGISREWVTLEASDDRPERFWLIVALALERAIPGAFTESVASTTGVHRLHPEFLDRLMADWAAVSDPLVLVLDDAHYLGSPSLTDDLAFVVDHLPHHSRILLTSRVVPPLPLGRWRGRSWLAEIHQRDLALTLPESVLLVAALDEHRLTATDIERLWRHTEGWAAGLRLAISGLTHRDDVSAAVAEFSGRDAVVADLLTEEVLLRAPEDLAEFLLRTSVVDVLDAELCNALSGRTDSGDVLRSMEAELQFVTATGADRTAYRYHPLLAEMLRSQLELERPDELPTLYRAAAAVFENRHDVVGAVSCLLAAGDSDGAFAIVSDEAARRAELVDIQGIAALVNLFPRELVSDTAGRMLTYSLLLGLCGQVDESHAWLRRASVRIEETPEPDAKDLATLDAYRLLTFAVTAQEGDAIDAGRRAVEAIDDGIDLGLMGTRIRMNLVRGYLLLDDPLEAEETLRAGDRGDEVVALLLAPALAARIALRKGHLSEAERQSRAALRAADALGMSRYLGALDAHLATLGICIDRNELTRATLLLDQLDELLGSHPEGRVYNILIQLEKVRVAAGRGDIDGVFALLREAGKLVEHLPGTAVSKRVCAVAARWHLEVGELHEAQAFIGSLSERSPAHTLLSARLELASDRPDGAAELLAEARFATLRDQVLADLLCARATVASNRNEDEHVRRAVQLAAPERLVLVFLEEGPTVARLARVAAGSLRTEDGHTLAAALGAAPRIRDGSRQPTAVLSEREAAVLRFLPTRLTNSEIAAECLMSVNTVKTHLKSIYAKLGVSTRAEAVSRARLLDLI